MENISEKVKQNIDRLFGLSVDERNHFFNSNKQVIRQTAVDYQYLQYMYKNSERLAKDTKFITMFRQFYIMRYIPRNSVFEKLFFEIMDEIRANTRTELDVVKITEELHEKVAKSDEKSRNARHLSFVSKMLNLHDDTQYPIYDRQVGFVCGVKDTDSIDVKYKKVQAVYSYIKENYDKHSLFRHFKTAFLHDKEPMSDERITDLLLWQWGSILEKEKHPVVRTPQEKHLENITNVEEWIKQGGKKRRMDMIDGGLDRDAVFEWFYNNN